jgi:hypothetical protein
MRTLACIVLAASCALAFAQAPVYRSTMPDGKRVISDRPMPGAVKVEEIKVSPGNTAPGSPVPQADKAQSVEGQRRANVKENLADAQRALDEALEKQAKGKEEGAGDRIGTAKGGARISDEYYKRQETLAAEVEAARKRLEEARRAAQAAR